MGATAARFPRWVSGARFWRWGGALAERAWEYILADAIAAELNAPNQKWTSVFTQYSAIAQVALDPWYVTKAEIALLANLQVNVVPLTIARDRASRGSRKFDYGIGIDMQMNVEPGDDATQRALALAAQQIHDHFDDGHLLNVIPYPGNWTCLKAEREDVYSLDQLFQQRTWETYIAVAIRGNRV